MGAGSVGCWVGGCLQAAGADVTFIGRPRVLDALRAQGLALTSLDGRRIELPAARLTLAERPPLSGAPALVLLTVKSAATRAAAAELARALAPSTPVLSLQNGIGNADAARAAAPVLEVIAGMVPFNVAELGPARFHRGTSGALAAADHPALRAWLPTFAAAGLPLELHADMRGVQWAKLLLNLNNPVNALSGLPLREELLIRGYRRVLAALQDEALAALAAARIEPARLTPLPARALPWVLRLPTPLFRRVASKMLRIDGQARSSMADDLAAGRTTEIDALCGEVVAVARGLGLAAPLNARISGLVREWPLRRKPWPAAELARAVGLD
ncbi:MAG TPA: 2-dehydropantoate 2-reductase [Burkholderiaceae bacterium]|nr:2-dehydropantoate 2-reductase [Burkholderiaceae bacterium]